MAGFAKLFSSITESSIWTADDKTLRVWIAMLARADSVGVVEGSVPGFASLCRLSVKDFERALEKLYSPDPYSRTPDNEGRRLEPITGGWKILNYVAYRNRCQSKEGSRAADMRRYRGRKKEGSVTSEGNALPTNVTGDAANVTRDTEAEAEAEAENKERVCSARPPETPPVVKPAATGSPAVEPPTTRTEFDAIAERNAVPKEVADWVWDTHEGRGWVDAAGQPVRNWAPILRRAKANREAQTYRQKHGGRAGLPPSDHTDPNANTF